MRETIVRLTPQLRRYAHALLGSWPAASRTEDGRPRPDQEADDLAQEALLGFWRASDGAAPTITFGPETSQVLLLYRRVTELARERLVQNNDFDPGAAERASFLGKSPSPIRAAHYAWAPESRALPRLPYEFRALLALVALERLTYEQAGEVLDMSREQALSRLAFARVRLAGEISGRSHPHLHALGVQSVPNEPAMAGGPVTEGDLHKFIDDFLDAGRREEIVTWLETHPETTRRVSEWRRHSERLRLAFEPLMRAPLPLSLNFSRPSPAFLPGSRGQRRSRGFLAGLAAILAGPANKRPASLDHKRPFAP